MRILPDLALPSTSCAPRLAFGGAERAQVVAPRNDTRIQRLLFQPAAPTVVITQLWGRGSLHGVASVRDILGKSDFRLTGSLRIGPDALDFIADRQNNGAIRLKLTEALPNPLAPQLASTLAMTLNARGGFSAWYVEPARQIDSPVRDPELQRARALADGLLQALAQAVQENRFYAAGEKPSGRAMARVGHVLSPPHEHARFLPADSFSGHALAPDFFWMRDDTPTPVCANNLQRLRHKPMNGANGRVLWQARLTLADGSPLGVGELDLAEVQHPGTGRAAGLVTLRLQPDDEPQRLIMIAYLPANTPKAFAAGVKPQWLVPGEQLALLAQASASDVPQAVREDIAQRAYPQLMACLQAISDAILAKHAIQGTTARKPLVEPPEERNGFRQWLATLIPSASRAMARSPERDLA